MESDAQQPFTFDQVAALHAPPPDQTIAYGPGPQQFGHLRLPKGAGPHRVVIFIHGGCYRAEYSIAHAAALEQDLADRGYAVWSVEYRRVGDPGGGWPGTFHDLAAAADHLRNLARRYPLDLGQVVAAGHSAGGNSAWWLAGRHRIPRASPLHVDDPLPIRGVLALAPAGDFAEMHAKKGCGGMIDQLMGGSPQAVPERYRAASPGEIVPTVPTIAIIGGQDAPFAPFGRSLVTRAQQAGEKNVRMIEIADANHFDVIAPPSAAWTVVIGALDQLFR